MSKFNSIIDQARELVKTGRVNLEGPVSLSPELAAKAAEVRIMFMQFLKGLNWNRELSKEENEQIRVYAETIEQACLDIYKVEKRAMKQRIPAANVSLLENAAFCELAWEVSGQIGEIIGWFQDFGDRMKSTKRIRIAGKIFRHHPRKNLDKITSDPRFSKFKKAPWIFKYAVGTSVSDPETFLLTVLNAIKDLEKDPEFKELRKTPGVFTRAAVNNTGDPRGYLRMLLKNRTKISSPGVDSDAADDDSLLKTA